MSPTGEPGEGSGKVGVCVPQHQCNASTDPAAGAAASAARSWNYQYYENKRACSSKAEGAPAPAAVRPGMPVAIRPNRTGWLGRPVVASLHLLRRDSLCGTRVPPIEPDSDDRPPSCMWRNCVCAGVNLAPGASLLHARRVISDSPRATTLSRGPPNQPAARCH